MWNKNAIPGIWFKSKVKCGISRVHKSFFWLVCVEQRPSSCMLGKLSCVRAVFVLIVARQLRRYPLKRQNSPSSLFSCFKIFFFLHYILGQWKAFHWPERQRVLSYSGFSHTQCTGLLLGLALVVSLLPPSVLLFILCSSNYIILKILLPNLKINSCNRKIQFFIMNNAKQSFSCVYLDKEGTLL